MCRTGDLLSLFKNIPDTLHHARGPWYEYLRAVYHQPVPLPFNLRRLELFYPGLLPTSSHLCRFNPYSPQNETALLPPCTGDDDVRYPCDEWSRSASEVERDKRFKPGWARGQSILWTPLTGYWTPPAAAEAAELRATGASASRLRLSGRHLFVGLQKVFGRGRAHFPDNTWVEVIRIGMGRFGEGGSYGCWFWPMKGSGIFINVGRSARASGKHHVVELLNMTDRSLWHDHYFATAALARGYNSVQILSGTPTVGGRLDTFYYKTNPFMEIISVDGACVSSNFPPPPPPLQPPHSEPDSARAAPPSAAAPPALRNRNRGKDGVNFAYGQENGGRTIAGGCVPIETRTGWDATLPCSCSDESIILNCINGSRKSAHG